MPQCEAQTKAGTRCRRQAEGGSRYCHQHGSNAGLVVASGIGGALIGNLFAPGIGALIGALIGGAIAASGSRGGAS
jgi:hypothetical protein